MSLTSVPSDELCRPFQMPLANRTFRSRAPVPSSNHFRDLEDISVKIEKMNRTIEDLSKIYITWQASPTSARPVKKLYRLHGIGASSLEKLPTEILDSIIDLLAVEVPHHLNRRNADLMAMLLTSRTIYKITLTILYRNIIIPHSGVFVKLLDIITKFPSRAAMIRRLDLNQFNTFRTFDATSERYKTQNLMTSLLSQFIECTPNLHEFLAQEYLDIDLSPPILRKLLFDMPRLQALDFCGCWFTAFNSSFNVILQDSWPEILSITRLSFHKCVGLPSAIFETMMPRLGKLTHLDVAATSFSDEALGMIPTTARITHLNLASCNKLSGKTVVEFLTSHPAAKDSLVYLSLAAHSANKPLLVKEDIDCLLPHLPKTLKSLCLRGSRMHSSHISWLIGLTKGLEELAIGHGLDMSDVHKLFCQDQKWLPHNLRYIDISGINTIISSAGTLLAPASAPLEVIEVEKRTYEWAVKVEKRLERIGWTTTQYGSRSWLVRMKEQRTTSDNGDRWWKMGAEGWGMRKIPVAVAEVGAIYGSYMFGRRL